MASPLSREVSPNNLSITMQYKKKLLNRIQFSK